MAVALCEVHGLVLEVEVCLGLGDWAAVSDLPAFVQAICVAIVEEREYASQQRIRCRQEKEVIY